MEPVSAERAPHRRQGRPWGLDTLALRILLDHSLLEVFTGSGQVRRPQAGAQRLCILQVHTLLRAPACHMASIVSAAVGDVHCHARVTGSKFLWLQVITTRVYRGAPPSNNDCGLDFLSFGGSAELSVMNAWEMRSIWDTSVVCAPSYLLLKTHSRWLRAARRGKIMRDVWCSTLRRQWCPAS